MCLMQKKAVAPIAARNTSPRYDIRSKTQGPPKTFQILYWILTSNRSYSRIARDFGDFVVSFGSPLASELSEYMLSTMFGGEIEIRLPFYFVWHPRAESHSNLTTITTSFALTVDDIQERGINCDPKLIAAIRAGGRMFDRDASGKPQCGHVAAFEDETCPHVGHSTSQGAGLVASFPLPEAFGRDNFWVFLSVIASPPFLAWSSLRV